MPNSNSVNIALAKKAKIVTGSEMPPFFAAKLKANGGDPANAMLARFGGSVTVAGVRIATVAALHSNGVDPGYIGGELGKAMAEAGIAGDVGLATGYVLRFSNGLVAYLSGDTGITADQDLVVRGHYGAKLAVMNIGDGFTTGPVEAAYVINELVKPASVIASHANEVGTVGGKVRPGSKTENFIKMTKVPVHIPLSGKTMEFDAAGKCVGGVADRLQRLGDEAAGLHLLDKLRHISGCHGLRPVGTAIAWRISMKRPSSSRRPGRRADIGLHLLPHAGGDIQLLRQ
jgi:L-ascorbate metabolism protein UlaG (beta-lactamase superfamily)